MEQLQSESRALYELLSDEPDFPAVVVSLAFVDQCLASLLKTLLIDGSTSEKLLSHRGTLGTFNARSDLAYCLPQFFYDTPRRRFILVVTLITNQLLVEGLITRKRVQKVGWEAYDNVIVEALA
jgi:hypothetical protein